LFLLAVVKVEAELLLLLLMVLLVALVVVVNQLEAAVQQAVQEHLVRVMQVVQV
jgi:hypothetical protein